MKGNKMKIMKLQFRGRRVVLSTVGGLVGALALAVGLALPANAAIGTLGPGSSGSQVKVWQQDLNFVIEQLNECHPTLAVDGQYGSLTTNATVCIQNFFEVSADGVEGPQTRAAVCNFMINRGERGSSLYNATCV
jgi:hypothetical protein